MENSEDPDQLAAVFKDYSTSDMLDWDDGEISTKN